MPVQTGTLAGAAFAAAVAQVAVAAGRDDTLPVLTGIRLEIEGETLTLAATDRYRLAVREIPWTPEQPGRRGRRARARADPGRHGEVAGAGDTVSLALAPVRVGEGLLGIEGAGRRTTTRLLDGEFPKYRSLLPSESLSVATVETGAVRRGGQAGLAGRRAQHPGPAVVHRRRAPARRRHRRRRAGDRVARGRAHGRPDHHRVQPAVPPRRARGHRRADGGAVVHHVDEAGRPHRPVRRRRRRPARATATCSCPSASRADVHVAHLSLTDFRSYAGVELPLGPGVTSLVGPNGQGKTNLVEAIGYARHPVQPPGRADAPLVRQGADRAVLRVSVVRDGRPTARRGRGQPGPGQPRAHQPLAGAAGPRGRSACCAPSSSRRRTSPWSRATRASGVGSSTTCSSRGPRGWPACAPTTTGSSSSATLC